MGGVLLAQAVPNWAFATTLPANELIHRSSKAMGTSLQLSLLREEFSSRQADLAFERLLEVDRLLTVHNPDSLLMRLNRSPGAWMQGRALSDVAKSAVKIGDLSEGALDVTILPAMRRLGFVPGAAAASDRIDYSKIQIDEEGVRISESGIGVDMGGIAKGYGVDEAVRSLRVGGLTTALIDAGGDLYGLGRPDTDRRWKVGIRHPERKNDLIASLEIENEAVATSGTYMQKRIVRGQEVSHLIDPRSGRPVDHIVSSTIVSHSTMLSDGLATATSVMAPRAAQALIESLPEAEGFWIYSDGTHHITSGLRSRLSLF